MTTIVLDEITRNAVLAALDERALRLQMEIDYYSASRRPRDEDTERALVWNIAALHETNMARLQIGEAEPWTESEMRVAAGNR